jgi:tripartite-type tricarboxylate transporter receptor subunit TctC
VDGHLRAGENSGGYRSAPAPGIARVVNDPEYSKLIVQQGGEPALLGPEEFGALVRGELERWGKLVKALGVTAE